MPGIEVIRPLKISPTGGTELAAGNRGSNNILYGRTSRVGTEDTIGTLFPGEVLFIREKSFVWVINERLPGNIVQQPAILDLRYIRIREESEIPLGPLYPRTDLYPSTTLYPR